MDANISRLIVKLKETGQFDNTFIIFTSDNGPSYRGSPAPWTGGKADLHEGGIRVPMIACWPNRISSGRVYNGFAHSNDILNTFAEAAGLGVQQNDGTSILPLLEGSVNEVPRGMVFWQLDQAIDPWGNIWYPQPGSKPEPYANCVVRDGEWKLLTDSIIPMALYKLDIDPLEQNNLLDTYPEQKSKMLDSLKVFLSAPRLSCGRNSNDPRSL
jgi:N-acetylgalactosamine-6-sulfatase